MDHTARGAGPLSDPIDVLVVGGGPTGLSAGLALAAHDVRMLVVEARRDPAQLPRSRLLDVRTVEILRRLGVADEIAAAALRSQRVGAPFTFATNLARAHPSPTMVQGWFGASLVSPVESVICPQDRVEGVLRAHLPVGRLRSGVRLLDLHQDADGVDAELGMPDGARQRVRARYVVGADGEDSAVRALAGVAMSGHWASAWVASVLIESDLTPLTGDRVCNAYFLEPDDGPQAILHPTAVTNRWTLNLIYRDRERWKDVLWSDQRCARDVRAALGDDPPDLRLLERQGGRVGSAVATRMVQERILLAGDAAHQVSLVSGAGMTLGVGDADNLAWKLAAVLDGAAGPGLLRTYETERRAVAHRFVAEDRKNVAAAFGDGPGWTRWRDVHARRLAKDGLVLGASYDNGALVPEPHPRAEPDSYQDYLPDAAPGCRAPHAYVVAGAGHRSVLDEFGTEAVLLTADRIWAAAADEASLRTRVPIRVRVLPRTTPVDAPTGPGSWLEVYGIGAHGAVLVRPDGYVAWRRVDAYGGAAEPGELAAVVTDVLARCWSATVAPV